MVATTQNVKDFLKSVKDTPPEKIEGENLFKIYHGYNYSHSEEEAILNEAFTRLAGGQGTLSGRFSKDEKGKFHVL